MGNVSLPEGYTWWTNVTSLNAGSGSSPASNDGMVQVSGDLPVLAGTARNLTFYIDIRYNMQRRWKGTVDFCVMLKQVSKCLGRTYSVAVENDLR